MKKIRGILYFNGFTVAGVNKGSCVLSIIFLLDGVGAAAGLGLDQAGKQMKHAAVHLQAFVGWDTGKNCYTGYSFLL